MPYPLPNFEIQKYYQNKPIFIGVYSRDNLQDKVKDRAFVVNLDEYSDIGTIGLICIHWIIMLLILIVLCRTYSKRN